MMRIAQSTAQCTQRETPTDLSPSTPVLVAVFSSCFAFELHVQNGIVIAVPRTKETKGLSSGLQKIELQ